MKSVQMNKNPLVQFILQFIVFSMLLGVFIYFYTQPTISAGIKNLIALIMALPLLLMFILILKTIFNPLLGLFWYLFRHPKIAGLTVLVVIALAFFIRYQINEYQYRQALSNLDNLQESMTPIFLTRIIGYDVEDNHSYPSGWSKNRIYKELGNSADATHDVPSLLIYYVSDVSKWGQDIILAAAGDSKWEDVADQPDVFPIRITDAQLSGFFEKSIEKISNLKQFGDLAITRGDRESMKVVAAKLALQQHFLFILSLAKTPPLFGQTQTVYAVEPIFPGGLSGNQRNPCIKSACLNEVARINANVYKSALGFAAGEAGAVQAWKDDWQEASQMFEKAGHPIGGTGITEGGSDQPKNPPLVQAFFDSCKTTGGTIGDTGGVKMRLPTTESGYTCWQPKSNGKCWKLLTYSGGRYAGGDAGVACPEQNLLPPPLLSAEVEPKNDNGNNENDGDQVVQPKAISWDGNYHTQSSGNCEGFAAGTAPDQFSVSNNTVVIRGGYSAPINSSGQAQISADLSQSGVSIVVNESFQFSNPGQPVVNGNFSARAAGQGVSMNCTGSFSGSRQ